MKKTIYILLGGLALAAALTAWQRQERSALRERMADLRKGNAQLAAALLVASVPKAPEMQNMQEDALAEVRAALAMPAGAERDAALNAGLLLQDLKPADALEVLPYFSGTAERQEALEAIFSKWGRTDPAAAAAASGKIADKIDGYYAQKALISTWGAKDPGPALAWAQTLPDGLFKAVSTEEIAKAWAANDLPGVLGWLDRASAGEAWDEVFRTVSAQWANDDPKKALDYLFRLPAGPLVGDTIASVVTAYANTDPVAAAAYVGKIPDPKSQQTAALAVGIAWGAKDHAAAQQWALSLPAGDTRDSAMASVAGGWEKGDPTAAMTWVQSWPAGEARDNAVQAIIGEWQYQGTNPQLMTELAAGMQEGEGREVVYKVIAMTWGNRDPDATAQWVQSLPDSPSKDMAAWMFVEGLHLQYADDTKQLTQAAPLVTAIQNDKERYNAIEALARMWLAADRPTAEAWLAQTNLPDARKQVLLQAGVAK